MIHSQVNEFMEYARVHLRLREDDFLFSKNAVMNLLDLHEVKDSVVDIEKIKSAEVPDNFVKPLSDYAIEKGLVEEIDRGLFETALLGAVTPMPSQTNDYFKADIALYGKRQALLNLYDLGIKSNYIKLTDVRRNKYWKHKGKKCDLEITINLSKPEKDNKEIARLKSAPQTGYPKCMLCEENVGYKGRLGFPARQTLRYVPITLAGEEWNLQYSPYMYYDEHCIIFAKKHSPMTMNKSTFKKLLSFTELFPDYIAGSNACLPIVGGSILSHEHYQGGGHLMPVHFTSPRWTFTHDKFSGVKVTVQEWYNSDIRISANSIDEVVEVADYIHEIWKEYTDESVGIIAKTSEPHNAVTPIARKVGDTYTLDMLLRNNRTDDTYPDGIFHAHPEYHNIKKEGIGLIEAMGLFILPGRLAKECDMVADILAGGEPDYSENSPILKHKQMIEDLKAIHKNPISKEVANDAIRNYIGVVCENILMNTAVFKDDQNGKDAFLRFMQRIGFRRQI